MGFLSFFLSVPNASVQAPKQQGIAAIDSAKVAETPKIPSPPVAPVSEVQVVKPNVKVVEEKPPLKLDNQPTASKLTGELSKNNLNPVPQPKARKDKGNGSGSSSSRFSGHGGYLLGPRGGCYYINSHGNKTYVDHSLCR